MLKEINKTKKLLKQYKCTFKEYMRDSGRRDDINLGEEVGTEYGTGVIVGWNMSSNYNVFIISKLEVVGLHPNEVNKIA